MNLVHILHLETDPPAVALPDETDLHGLAVDSGIVWRGRTRVDIDRTGLECVSREDLKDALLVLFPGTIRLGTEHHWLPAGATVTSATHALPGTVVAKWLARPIQLAYHRGTVRWLDLPSRDVVGVGGVALREPTGAGQIGVEQDGRIVQLVTVAADAQVLASDGSDCLPGTRLVCSPGLSVVPFPAMLPPISERIAQVMDTWSDAASPYPGRRWGQLIKLAGDDPDAVHAMVPPELVATARRLAGSPVKPQLMCVNYGDHALTPAWNDAADRSNFRFLRGLRRLEEGVPPSPTPTPSATTRTGATGRGITSAR